LRAGRDDLFRQGDLIRLELVRSRLKLRLFPRVGLRLAFETRLLTLEARLLLLESLLLLAELLTLERERVRLCSQLLLLAFPCFCSCRSWFCRLSACFFWLVYSLLVVAGVPSLIATSSGPL
jgi:hypothetical protein